jgi:outer membrane receptor for ferrienterochelin and colicin
MTRGGWHRSLRRAGAGGLFAAALAVLGAGSAGADSPGGAAGGAIVGHVKDSKTADPLSFCNVVIDSVGGTMTDMKGNFVLRGIRVGRYRLTISRIGHRPVTVPGVVVSAGDTTRVDVALDPAPVHMDPVVVTASRVEQTARMAPASVAVVDQADIAQRAPATFDQAIEAVSGLNAFRTTGISVQSMQIRGSSDVAGGGVGNRVLLLVDGRPALTSDTGGAFWSLVPTQSVDRVEVVKGAFSSLYGSTAMGGVVNVITRTPGRETVGKLDFKLGFFEAPDEDIRYTQDPVMQSEVTADISGSMGRSKRNLRYLLSASRKASDGFSENTEYAFYDVYGKLIFDLTAERKLELTLGGGQAKNDYPHSWLSSAQPLEVRDAYTDDRQYKNYANADLHYWAMSGDKTRLSSRMYYYHHEQVSRFNEDDPDQQIPGNEPYGFETEIIGDKVGAVTQVDVRANDRNRLVSGVDLQFDCVQSAPDTTLYGDHQINNYAVFVQDDIDLSSSVAATIGARYDWNHLVGARTLEQVSPKVAVVWTATPELAIRGLFGQAFRAPTIAELFLERELGGGIDFVPNPELGAEHIVASGEVGVRWNPDPLFGLDAAAFRYDYEDMIYWIEISDELGVSYPVYQVRNLNSALMAGVELTATSTWRALALSANYTYLDARDRSEGREDDVLAYRPKHSANIAADVGHGRWMLHGDARYRSDIEEVFLFPLQAPTAYWIYNANVQFRVSDRITASVKVNNVLDVQYEELARYRMPGRNWTFGVAFTL